MLNSLALFALVSVLPAFISAQSPLYGQCGGKEWSMTINLFHSQTLTGKLSWCYDLCLWLDLRQNE